VNFQTRIFLAVALCAFIFITFDFLRPKPTPEELAAQEAAQLEAKEGAAKTKKAIADEPRGPEPRAEADEPAVPVVPLVDHELHNELLALAVTNRSPARGGLVTGVQLLSPQFQGHATATDALGLAGKRTLEVSLTNEEGDPLVPREAAYEVREATTDRITLVHTGALVEVTERLELLGGYEARLEVEVKNRGRQALSQRVHVRTRIGVSESQYDIRRGVCRTLEDVEDEDASDLEDGKVSYTSGILWGGVDGKYFTSLVVPKQPAQDCEIVASDDASSIETRLGTAAAELAPGGVTTHVFGLYIGPKELERLKAFAAVDAPVTLDEAIDWGFFGGVSEWLGKMLLALLRWFHELVANWGVSIVLLTITVKAITLPLTLKQMSSMKRMKEINPEMTKIKEKYADDRVKQGQEMQALFARSGVNPLAGCFPMLVQLPIWFALYSMLGAAVELVHEPFLWLPDLTEQDPYYILPLALGALMILQNRMMPSTMDPAQAKLMRWVMPIMFTVFMLFLPSGLGVYIFANIVLSLIQTAIQVGTNKNPQAAAS
jgi:YidC/Oxa1 family membrane protein insertase